MTELNPYIPWTPLAFKMITRLAAWSKRVYLIVTGRLISLKTSNIRWSDSEMELYSKEKWSDRVMVPSNQLMDPFTKEIGIMIRKKERAPWFLQTANSTKVCGKMICKRAKESWFRRVVMSIMAILRMVQKKDLASCNMRMEISMKAIGSRISCQEMTSNISTRMAITTKEWQYLAILKAWADYFAKI